MRKIYLKKAKAQIARPTKIRAINRQIVLNYIRARAPISRAEIARETDLQRSTVSSIVNSLKKSDLIEEIGEGDSTGGRKPTLLKIKEGKAVAIGVDVTPRTTTIAVADLLGNVLEKEKFATTSVKADMSDRIVASVAKFAEKYGNDELEVGISVPGITDHKTGVAAYVPYFQWKDWKIGQKITEKTGLHVSIDNDANAIALAELWFGNKDIRTTRNFVTVLIAEGVGTGIIFEGQVYRGDRGAAGEFGHMIMQPEAPVSCSCGSNYCWEAHASEKSIIARYLSYSGNGNGESAAVDIDQLIEMAESGSENAIRAFHDAAEAIGIGIANLILGLSPQAVIVSGKVSKAWKFVGDELEAAVKKNVRQKLPETDIMFSSLGLDPTLTGAISLVLARKFASAM